MANDSAPSRDAVMQAHVPAVMVPRFENFPPLEVDGHRYLVAEDGLWIEVRRPWLHLVWPLAESAVPLPYGPVLADEMEFAFDLGSIEFVRLVGQFSIDAHRSLPAECAAWFVWNACQQRLEYRPLIAISAGPCGITFHRPQLAEHEHLAVDLHSHGAMEPFFSATDDADDAGEVKLSVVLGGLRDIPSTVMRLCAHGLFIPIEEQ